MTIFISAACNLFEDCNRSYDDAKAILSYDGSQYGGPSYDGNLFVDLLKDFSFYSFKNAGFAFLDQVYLENNLHSRIEGLFFKEGEIEAGLIEKEKQRKRNSAQNILRLKYGKELLDERDNVVSSVRNAFVNNKVSRDKIYTSISLIGKHRLGLIADLVHYGRVIFLKDEEYLDRVINVIKSTNNEIVFCPEHTALPYW